MTGKIVLHASVLAMVYLLLQGEAPLAQTSTTSEAAAGTTETGIAIFYSDAMQGKAVASGEKYDKDALTAAHRTLPLGTMVKVTNLKNNKSVVVKVNDRGPHGSNKRIIDLSRRAAQELDMIQDGKAQVMVEVVR
jgi:peptidoglycan lytic transglycosylase